MRGDALDLLNGSVDYPALIGIHGLEHHVPAVLPDLSRILAGKGSESILSLLAVIADIDRQSPPLGFRGRIPLRQNRDK